MKPSWYTFSFRQQYDPVIDFEYTHLLRAQIEHIEDNYATHSPVNIYRITSEVAIQLSLQGEWLVFASLKDIVSNHFANNNPIFSFTFGPFSARYVNLSRSRYCAH